jgi:hypothetical protein
MGIAQGHAGGDGARRHQEWLLHCYCSKYKVGIEWRWTRHLSGHGCATRGPMPDASCFELGVGLPAAIDLAAEGGLPALLADESTG